MDNPQQPPAILSLCTGGGMLDDGLERAIGPVLTVAYVEIEAFCVWNLVAKMEAGLLDPAPVFTNLKTFPAKPFHGKIHGIIGGYPCQPFSHAGQRKGEADERHLFPHICTIIDAVRPLWCFFENVPGHLSMGYDEVYRSLRALGYRVEAGIYSAAEVGATHERERLFILAIGNTRNESKQAGIDRRQEHQQNNRQPLRHFYRTASEAMGNTETAECESTGNTRRGCNGFTDTDNQMGDTISTGQQQSERSQPGRAQQPTVEYTGANHSTGHSALSTHFPAPPGHPQHDWEAPRVESGLGFSAHGYNFREDLLRMAGNGVVPQTAAKAFIELSKRL